MRRTVFILGAGFSKTFDIPLGNEFLLKLVEESNNENFIHRINATCRNFYPNFVDIYKNYPNIEDFFNYNYSVINYYRLWGEHANRYIDNFVPEFKFGVAEYLDKKSRNFNPKQEFYLEKFNDMVNPGDVIITFNWDTVVESFLKKKKRKISFLFVDNPENITILKLHGSIDWVKTVGLYRANSRDLLVVKDYKEEKSSNILRYDEENFLLRMKKENRQPYIIPPLAYKDEMIKPLGYIWGSAYSALCVIKRKVFVGYSFPKEDTLARVLLSSYPYFMESSGDSSHRKEERVVINPDEMALFYYNKYYNNEKITFWNTTFADYVDAAEENISLRLKLSRYKDILLTSTDKFVHDVASRIFSKELYEVDMLEKRRIVEYLSESHDINIEL